MPDFVHLRVHSEYSLVDGIVTIDALAAMAASTTMPAVALTDQCNLFAAVKFYKASIAAGIKPLLGVDVWLHNTERHEEPFRFTLLCQNRVGYRNLTRLLSRAYLEGQQYGVPCIQKSWLSGATEGLITLSGGCYGDIGQALLKQNQVQAENCLKHWLLLFPDRFYLEVTRLGKPNEEIYHQALLPLAVQYKVPVVATNDVRFLSPDDFDAHEARVCIHEGSVLADPKRSRRYTAQQYLRTPAEMAALFEDMPEAIANTVEIARRCNLTLELGKAFLPNFPVPSGYSVEQYLSAQAKQGLQKRFACMINTADKNIYQERLATELDVINGMGFAGYFLIVSDFIQWAKQQFIPVGPGRGSGAGSLVAYALEITDIDPIPYDLLFERFLNPERVSMPDFDIDFCMDGRDRVIDYVAEKYGRDSVSQIITYGSMAAKAVVRDVGRVLGHPYGFVDKIAKLIPFELGMTLEKALIQETDLKSRYDEEEEVHILLDLAMKLEGITRNAGKHAGGVVISPSLLTDFTPLYCEPDGTNLITQFDKDDIEAVGLVKFDFLGLRTLTIIAWAVNNINILRAERHEAPLSINQLPIDDAKTYALIKSCATTAIFQLESRGMKDLVKRLQPDCFEDIVALVALFRPGPLQSGMVDDFINRKHGRASVDYFHPDLTPVLRSTYGIILYQEQVMQIAQILAGYTLGSADLLRRAMSKRKPEEMAKQRAVFMKGAEARKISKKLASTIFDLMEKFAAYGFNKSHSAAYALVSYQTAWLKAHYPAEFMAAVLSSDMDNTDKVVGFLYECRQMRLKVLPPDVNSSMYRFTVSPLGEILYGLGAIKGAGEAAIESIIQNRITEGMFKNLFDFCGRIDTRKVNRRVLESFIKAGAMDSFGINRAALMASLDNALQAAEQKTIQDTLGQQDLFGLSTAAEHKITCVNMTEWPMLQRLQGEKETLGFYHSGHPLVLYEKELSQLVSASITELSTDTASVTIAGIVTAIRTLFTKRGQRMAIVTIEDKSGKIDITLFSETFDTHKALLLKDAILIIEGDLSEDDFTGSHKLLARNVYNLDKIREKYAKSLILTLKARQFSKHDFEKLETVLFSYRNGNCPVTICYQHDAASTNIQLGASWRVHVVDTLLQQLQGLFGEEQVSVKY